VADQPSRRNVGRTNTHTQKEKDDFHILDGGERDSISDFGVKNGAGLGGQNDTGYTGNKGEYENPKVQGANESSRSSANQSPRQRPRQTSIGRSEERGGGGGDDGSKCRDSPIPQYGINDNGNSNSNGNTKNRNSTRNVSNYNGTTGTGDTVNRQTDGRHHTRNLPLITSTVNSDADLELSLGIYSENHDTNYMNNIEKNKEFEREYEMDKVDNKERDKERSRIKERNRIKNEDKIKGNLYDNIMNNNNHTNNNNYDKKNDNSNNNDNSHNNDYDNNNNKDNNKYKDKDKDFGEILLNKNKVDARKLYEKRISREERSKVHRNPNNVIRNVVDDSEGEFKNGEIGGIRCNGNSGNDGNNGKCSRVNGLRDNSNNIDNNNIDHYDNYHANNSSINDNNITNNTNSEGTYSPNNNHNNNHQISTNIDKNKPIIRVNRRFKKAPPLPQDYHSEASLSEKSDTGGDEDKSVHSKTRIHVRNIF
jgi:hypothetical protein